MARRFASAVAALVLVVAVASVGTAEAGGTGAGQRQQASGDQDGFDFQGEHGGRSDIDNREGTVAPSAAARRSAAPPGEVVRFNRFGTAEMVTTSATGGVLAEGLSADPVEAAHQWIAMRPDLYGLTAEDAAALQVVRNEPLGMGHTVLLRQVFGGLPAGIDGQIGVAVVDGAIVQAWGSSTRDTELTGELQLTAEQAVAQAVGGNPTVRVVGQENRWTLVEVVGVFNQPVRARPVAVPTPTQGVQPSWELLLIETALSEGVSQLRNAETGDLLVQTDLVDHAEDPAHAAHGAGQEPENPEWTVFPVSPPLDYSTKDTREDWCLRRARHCEETVANPASPLPWDVDPATGASTNTSRGNNARSTEKWNSNVGISQGTVFATPRPNRVYDYPWTNQWFEQACNPAVFTSPQRNDIDAAITNLFVGHNRMHDWSYHLGFTEGNFNAQTDNFGRGGLGGDPEHGNAQAGGVVGGPPGYASRDNANQFWTPDGVAPTTNMFLWQPIPGSFYSPCVDGDYDMTVIGHEYGHLISNRMTGGPDDRLRDHQANAMGESWSDLMATEILHEFDQVPVDDENEWAIGPYVTGDQERGIRNYGMNRSPLNYSDVGYDLTGPQVHADGEIWSATNFAIRQAMNQRYGDGTRSLQERCARGERPASSCPGNYRWIQLMFDAWQLMPNRASMVDSRDAMLAADVMRFGGANQDLLWNTFARFGLGEGASSAGGADTAPIPDFTSPRRSEGTLTFEPEASGSGDPVVAQLFVGRYEARARPVADTDPATVLDDTVSLVPGTYELLVRANGYGTKRLTATVHAGSRPRDLDVSLSRNLASATNGAVASGDGVNLASLIDDTEATNWAASGAPVEGRQVTVRLDPGKASHQVDRVQVSALLRPPLAGNADPGTQNRFTALRQFEIWTCRATATVDCSQDSQYRRILTSKENAFPATAPRPRAPDMIIRSFDVPKTTATHVRLRVLDNQCTGTPAFRGDQDDDPRHDTDCVTGSAAATGTAQGTIVRAAELQVFDR
jgi:extracellular elastinolytic metalloproteinase